MAPEHSLILITHCLKWRTIEFCYFDTILSAFGIQKFSALLNCWENHLEVNLYIIFENILAPIGRNFEFSKTSRNLQSHSVHWNINQPLLIKDHPILFFFFFFAEPALNLQTIQAPIFWQFPSIYWFFVNPPLKKFLVKISQFKNSWLWEQKRSCKIWIIYLTPRIYPSSFVVW